MISNSSHPIALPSGVIEEVNSWSRILEFSETQEKKARNLTFAADELRKRARSANASPEVVQTVADFIETSLSQMASDAGVDLAYLTQARVERDGPIPLIPEKSESLPFPVTATGPLAKAIKAIAKKVQAPEPIAAQSVLAVASLAACPHADVLMHGQRRPILSFFVTIASSGDRKTSTDTEALRPVRRYEKVLQQKYDSASPAWKIAVAAWNGEKRKIEANRKFTYEDRKAALKELGQEPEQPIFPLLIFGDYTIEGLTKLWPNALAALGAISAEGAIFTGGHGMSADHRLKTAAKLSELWDGRPVSTVRAGDGLTILPGRRLVFHTMLQPGAAADFLKDPLLRDQGLLSRILVAAPASLAGTRTYREQDAADDIVIQGYSDQIFLLLQRPWPLAAGTRNELKPRALSLSPAAASIWREFYDHVEGQSGPDGALSGIRDFAAKAAEHAARLAGVLTIVEDVDAAAVDKGAMANAVELVDWYVTEAVRLSVASMANPRIVAAKKLLDWLLARPESSISVRTICQFGPAGLRNKAAVDDGLKVLADHGWVKEANTRRTSFTVWRAA
jgi:hypothetical protein